MSPRRSWTLACVVALMLGAMGAGVRWRRAATRARGEAAAWNRRSAESRNGAHRAEADSATASPPARAAGDGGADRLPRAGDPGFAEHYVAMMAAAKGKLHDDADAYMLAKFNPRLAATMAGSLRAQLRVKLAPLFQSLGLSAGQEASFENILIQENSDELDLKASAKANGVPVDDPSLASLQQEAQAREAAAITQLVGDSGYAQYQQYERELPVFTAYLYPMANMLGATDESLTTAQQGQILGILANASAQYQAGGVAQTSDIDWAAAIPETRSVLTPAQATAMEEMATSTQALQRAQQYLKSMNLTP